MRPYNGPNLLNNTDYSPFQLLRADWSPHTNTYTEIPEPRTEDDGCCIEDDDGSNSSKNIPSHSVDKQRLRVHKGRGKSLQVDLQEAPYQNRIRNTYAVEHNPDSGFFWVVCSQITICIAISADNWLSHYWSGWEFGGPSGEPLSRPIKLRFDLPDF
jgi:hypothetical protein